MQLVAIAFALIAVVIVIPVASAPAKSVETPEIFVQLGHSSDLCQIAFSPDGRVLASRGGCGYGDTDVKLWDVASGREIRTVTNTRGLLRFSPDGRRLAAGNAIWDTSNWKQIRKLEDSALVSGFSSDGSIFISSAQPDRRDRATKNGISIKEVDSGRIVRFIPVEYRVGTTAASPDGRLVAAAEEGLASGGSPTNAAIVIWEADTGRERYRLRGRAPIAFSPDSHRLALGSGDGVKVWELSSGREIMNLPAALARPFASVAFSPDGKKLAADTGGGRDKFGVKIWDATTGREIRTLQGTGPGIAFSPDGLVLASVGDNGIELWDVATGKRVRILKGNVEIPYSGPLISFTPSGNRFRIGDYLWDLDTGVRSKSLGDLEQPSEDRIVSSDGRLVATLNGDAGTLKLSDHTTGRVLWAVEGRSGDKFGPVRRFMFLPAYSPDSQVIAWMGRETITVAEARTGKQLASLPAPAARSVSFSPDGRLLATASTSSGDPDYPDTPQYNSLQIWELLTGREIYRIEGSYRWVSFSSDGRYLAFLQPGGDLGGYGSNIKIWDAATWNELHTIKAHHAFIEKVVFSPNSKLIVSYGYEGTIRVWDVATGRERAELVSFKDGSSIAITPEGYYVGSSEAAEENLNVRIGNRVFGIAAYREKFYRPDLVKLSLAGGLLSQFARLDQVLPAPQVEFAGVEPVPGTIGVKAKLRLSDAGGGIGDVRLFLNGTAVAQDRVGTDKGAVSPGSVIERSYEVQLGAGSRELSAVAFNADNTMRSNPAAIEVHAAAPATRPSLHAILVGIQEFKNPKFALGNSIADAKLFAETVQKYSGSLFQTVNVTLLTTPAETSRDSLTEALRALRKTVAPDDLFVFYVASHGLVDEGEYFLITSNVGSVSTERLKADALSQAELRELLSNIPSTKKLVVIDTCQAGALGNVLQSALLTRGLNEEAAMKILSRAVGSTVLSASTSLQDALEGYKGHGLLTFVLAEGLAGAADYDRDSFVSTLELATYIDKRVPELAEQVFHHAQYPIVSPSGQGFPITRVK